MMKCFASRFFSIVLKLSTALAACIGCSKPEAPKPRQIRWRGPETGYSGTTIIEPDDTSKADQENQP
jgi:hypothetical protein